MSDEWRTFLWTADEFLIEYSLPLPFLTAVKQFLIGHVVELYLKAAYTKMTGDHRSAINYGHKIKNLLGACQKHTPSFMQGYQIKDDVFNSIKSNQIVNDPEYFKHCQLYQIAVWAGRFKYFGMPQSIDGTEKQTSFICMWPDPYWTGFLKELRTYLGYPEEGKGDRIKHMWNQLPESSKVYLLDLYS